MGEKVPAKLVSGEKLCDLSGRGIFNAERLAWTKDLLGLKAETERDKLCSEIEGQAEIKFEKYNLGASKTDNSNVENIRKMDPEILVGSADSTRFEMKWHEPKWYKPYVEAASEVMALRSLFDDETLKWVTDLSPALEEFAELSKLSVKEFNKNVKKLIWKLVKQNGEKIIYGEKGLFNFLLAYRRIKNLNPALDNADQEDFEVDVLGVKKIKLVVGKGKGKQGGKQDRYAYAVVRKNKAERDPGKGPGSNGGAGVIDDVGGADAKAVDTTNPKADVPVMSKVPKEKQVSASEVVPGGSTDPEVSNPGKYEDGLDADDLKIFNECIAIFDSFLRDPNFGINFLKNSNVFDKRKGEKDNRHFNRLKKMFDNEYGNLSPICKQFDVFLAKFDDFFDSSVYPQSLGYLELYFWITKRMIDYVQFLDKNDELEPENVAKMQIEFHIKLLESAKILLQISTDKKSVLEQLIKSGDFVQENRNAISDEEKSQLQVNLDIWKSDLGRL